MTVRELIEELRKLPPDMNVEVEVELNGFADYRDAYSVRVDTVTRGIALPNPRTYDIAVIAS